MANAIFVFDGDTPTYRVKTFIPFIVPSAATEALWTLAGYFQLKRRLGGSVGIYGT